MTRTSIPNSISSIPNSISSIPNSISSIPNSINQTTTMYDEILAQILQLELNDILVIQL